MPVTTPTQPQAESVLQRKDMTAYSRLGKKQVIGGLGKISQISNPAETFEMPKIYGQMLGSHSEIILIAFFLKCKDEKKA